MRAPFSHAHLLMRQPLASPLCHNFCSSFAVICKNCANPRRPIPFNLLSPKHADATKLGVNGIGILKRILSYAATLGRCCACRYSYKFASLPRILPCRNSNHFNSVVFLFCVLKGVIIRHVVRRKCVLSVFCRCCL